MSGNRPEWNTEVGQANSLASRLKMKSSRSDLLQRLVKSLLSGDDGVGCLAQIMRGILLDRTRSSGRQRLADGS